MNSAPPGFDPTEPHARGTAPLLRGSSLLLVALGIFACRLVAGAYLITPWQNPDESSHFGYVWTLAHGPGFAVDPGETEQIESDILRSMAQFDWWRQYGEPTPDPVPSRFVEVSDHMTGIGAGAQPVYFVAAAAYLKLLRLDGLLREYGAIRILSGLCAILTIAAGWAGTRLLFGGTAAGVVALVLALHPQFLLVALTTGPDAFVNLLGAVIWWQAARMIGHRTPILAIAVMLACAGLIVLTKRLGAPVAAAVFPLIGLYALREFRNRAGRAFAAIAAVGVAIGGIAVLIWAKPEQYETLEYSWRLFLRPPAEWSPRASTWSYFSLYTREMLDSAWLVAGYLRYPAPSPWHIATYVLMASGALGVLIFAARGRRPGLRAGVLVAAGFTVVQLVAVYATSYTMAYGAQGRYLFPALAAFVALLWVGFQQYWPVRLEPIAAAALVAVMLALDVTGWLTVLVPAYVY